MRASASASYTRLIVLSVAPGPIGIFITHFSSRYSFSEEAPCSGRSRVSVAPQRAPSSFAFLLFGHRSVSFRFVPFRSRARKANRFVHVRIHRGSPGRILARFSSRAGFAFLERWLDDQFRFAKIRDVERRGTGLSGCISLSRQLHRILAILVRGSLARSVGEDEVAGGFLLEIRAKEYARGLLVARDFVADNDGSRAVDNREIVPRRDTMLPAAVGKKHAISSRESHHRSRAEPGDNRVEKNVRASFVCPINPLFERTDCRYRLRDVTSLVGWILLFPGQHSSSPSSPNGFSGMHDDPSFFAPFQCLRPFLSFGSRFAPERAPPTEKHLAGFASLFFANLVPLVDLSRRASFPRDSRGNHPRF